MKKSATIIRNLPCELSGLNRTEKILNDISKNEGKYILEQTNYTDTIIDQSGNKIIIAPSFTANKTFIASKKIISDFEKSNIVIDEIPKSAINYYKFREQEFFYDKAILIDINAAYPTALFLNGIITENTFDYLMSLKKIQRLKAIGMLASQKFIYEFENGECINLRKSEKNKNAEIYFLASYEIGEILEKCSGLNKSDFLFYWFDGIYIKPNWIYAAEIINFLESKGYKNSVCWIKDFSCKKLKNTFKISWTELTNSENDLISEKPEKNIFLPKKQNYEIKKANHNRK